MGHGNLLLNMEVYNMATAEMIASMITLAADNYNKILTEAETELRAGLWLQTFSKVPNDKFETAIRLALLNHKYFPNVSEINAAIKELNEEERTSQSCLQQLPRPRASYEMVKSIVEMSKQDLNATVLNFDVSGLMGTAKQYFAEITEETVQRNLSEFITLAQQINACCHCRMTDYCPMGGYRQKPRMHPSGYVILDVVKCEKKNVKVAI